MNNLKYIFTTLLTTLVLISGCIKQKQDPPKNNIPIGTVFTVQDVINLGNGYIFEDTASMYAIVTMDESNGNLNKVIYVQDSTAGISLTFPDNKSNLKEGYYLRISLNGLTVSDNNGMFTLKTLDAASNVIIISKGNTIAPKQVSISDVMTGNYNGQIVELINIEFQDTTVNWSDPIGLSTQNRTLQDCSGNTIIVRTSGYATFAGLKLPKGNGSLVAIAGVYGSTYQMYVRSLTEVDMTGARCVDRILLSETFALGQGNFSIVNVVLPSQASYVWSHDATYVCMKASCYIGGFDYASDSWLISPPIDFSRVTNANLTFEQAINHLDNFAAVADICQVLVSSNYISGDPTSSTWTALDLNYPSSGSWTFISSGSINLSSVAHQDIVRIAFRYKSVQGDAPTWEVKNVSVVITD